MLAGFIGYFKRLIKFIKLKSPKRLWLVFCTQFTLLHHYQAFCETINTSEDKIEYAETKELFPYWPKDTFEWAYNSSEEPNWIEPNLGLELFKNAALAWKDCGPKIKYMGVVSNQTTYLGDKLNTFGWGNLNAPVRAMTYRITDKRNLMIKESDIVVNVTNQDIQKNSQLLQKVVTHEFGHALGLLHAQGCNDVMSSASECGKRIANPPPLAPTEEDLNQCKKRYSR